MQRLVYLRHAESTNNDLYARTGQREGRVPDPLLSGYGERQADRLAELVGADPRLAGAPIWVSPTARAVQTGAAVARARARSVSADLAPAPALVLVPSLVEGGGIYERGGDQPRSDDRVAEAGRPLEELAALAPDVELRWDAESSAGWGGGFEPYDAIPARAGRVLAAVRESGAPVVVLVSHEWFGQHLIRAAMGLPAGVEEADKAWFGIPNASITEIELHGDHVQLVRLGDTHHLTGLESRSLARIV